MQITLNPGSAAEVRLIAAFMNDYADLVDLQTAPYPEQPPVVEPPPAAKEEPPKKTRAKKEAPIVTEPPVAAKEEPAGETQSAGTAEAPVESTDPATAEPVSLDDMRVLFGKLTQDGKRDAAIKKIRDFGFNGLSAITDDLRGQVFNALKAMQ